MAKSSAELRLAQLEEEATQVRKQYADAVNKGHVFLADKLSKKLEQINSKMEQVEKVLK